VLNQFETKQKDLTITKVDSLEAFRGLEADWDSLFKRSQNATIFQSFVWNCSFFQREKHASLPMILLIKEKDELVGIAPLRISNRIGIPKIEFIGSTFSGSYLSLLLENDREDICQMVGNYLAEHFKSAIFYIPYYNASEFSVNVLIASLMANSWSDNIWVRNISHYINKTESFDNFYFTKSSKSRSTIKKIERNLQLSGTIGFRKFTANDVTEELMTDIKRIFINSWLYERGVEHVYFGANTEVLIDMAKRGHVEIVTININQQAIAYIINLIANANSYLYMTAFDRNYEAYSPGRLLFKYVLEECLNKHYEYDFLFGQGDYKFFWANRTKFILSCVCYKGIKGWALGFVPYKVMSVVQNNIGLRKYAKIFKRVLNNMKRKNG